VPLQFNTGGSPLRFRRSGDDELEVESDDEFADIISQELDGGWGMGAGEEESALTIVKEVRVHCHSPYCRPTRIASDTFTALGIWVDHPPRTHRPPRTLTTHHKVSCTLY
jgi:hypothetical protein